MDQHLSPMWNNVETVSSIIRVKLLVWDEVTLPVEYIIELDFWIVTKHMTTLTRNYQDIVHKNTCTTLMLK